MATGRSYAGIIVVVIAAVLAVVVGSGLVTSQMMTLMQFAGVGVLALCILLGRRIWLLLPFASSLALTFRAPGLPSSLLIAEVLVVGFCVMLFLLRKLPYRLRFTELEILAILLVMFVVQVYARNPVGVSVFGSDMVGGKPYAMFAIHVVVCFLLSGLRVSPAEMKWVLRLAIIGGVLSFLLKGLGRLVPSVGIYYGAVSGFEDSEEFGQPPAEERAGRIEFLGQAGRNCSRWLVSFVSPLRALFKPLWLILMLCAVGFAAMSGYRNEIATVGLTLFFGLCYRGGVSHVLISAVIGGVGLALLAITNLMAPLPLNMQRALSFLPGTWEESVRRDARSSTDWRVEIWKEVLFTDRWIENKVLGDGLGFTKRELDAQLAARHGQLRGTSGFDAQRESILANGDYHSGPVQTIRTIGYLGLIVLAGVMIRLAVHAHRMIRRCRGTEWHPLSLFIGIPLLVQPIFFTFVFGTFSIAASTTLMGIGMMRLLENNIKVHEKRAGSVPESRNDVMLHPAAK